jgi:Phospholipase_D-nuclease N-terminal
MIHHMGRLYVFLFGLEILLIVLALISCLSADEGEIRALPRIVWVIIILLFPLVGSIVYFAVGRPVKAAARPGWRAGGGFPEPTRPRQVAPDDDPEFLDKLDRKSKREQEDLLKRWEEDLRKREENLRKEGDNPPGDG